MNSNFHIPLLLFLLFLLFIFTTSPSSAAKLVSQKGVVDQKINYINSKEPDVKISSVDDDSFDKLMGVLEECGNGDEECLMRRAVLEAHLDYIYTQKRIP